MGVETRGGASGSHGLRRSSTLGGPRRARATRPRCEFLRNELSAARARTVAAARPPLELAAAPAVADTRSLAPAERTPADGPLRRSRRAPQARQRIRPGCRAT